MNVTALHDALAAVCPIAGVSGPILPPSPWTTYPAADGLQWRIDFDASATAAQQQAGIAALAAYANTPPVPTVTGRQVKDQVKAAGASAAVVAFLAKAGQSGGAKPDDYLYWLGIALDTPIPVDNPKVGRILFGSGVGDVPGFMAAAALLPA